MRVQVVEERVFIDKEEEETLIWSEEGDPIYMDEDGEEVPLAWDPEERAYFFDRVVEGVMPHAPQARAQESGQEG